MWINDPIWGLKEGDKVILRAQRKMFEGVVQQIWLKSIKEKVN